MQLLCCSENEDSEGGNTETSDIQTYTAIANNESLIRETADDPDCICHSTNQCSGSEQPQSVSLDMEPGSCEDFGYSRGKCTDSRNDSDVLCDNSLAQSHGSAASLASSDCSDYTKTELREEDQNCLRVELMEPPIEPQMI